MSDDAAPRPVPRTVKYVSAKKLLELEALSQSLGFNQNLSPEWLTLFLDHGVPNFIFPELVHTAAAGQGAEPHLRCTLRVSVLPQEGWFGGQLLVSFD